MKRKLYKVNATNKKFKIPFSVLQILIIFKEIMIYVVWVTAWLPRCNLGI